MAIDGNQSGQSKGQSATLALGIPFFQVLEFMSALPTWTLHDPLTMGAHIQNVANDISFDPSLGAQVRAECETAGRAEGRRLLLMEWVDSRSVRTPEVSVGQQRVWTFSGCHSSDWLRTCSLRAEPVVKAATCGDLPSSL